MRWPVVLFTIRWHVSQGRALHNDMSLFSKLFGDSPNPPDPPDDEDEVILRSLRESGVDVAHELPVDFILYFPSESDARKALRTTQRDGFAGELHPPPSDDLDWMIVLSRRMVPSLEALREVRARLDELAAEHDGEFEGWDVARDE